MAVILDGKKIAGEIRQEIKKETEKIFAERQIKPGLAVIIVGDDPASAIYVRNKEKAAQEVGFNSVVKRYPANTSQEDLLAAVDEINNDESIHGMIVQLPLPKHLNEKEVIKRIDPKKDVDGLHPSSIGALTIGDKGLVSCTPKGCIHLIKETGIEISGKKAVVVGRSNMVGKPVALLLLQENATVTICHSRTKDLKAELQDADIIVAAVGIANLIKGDMVKKGAVVIDVGINRSEDGKLCGDVDFASASENAGFITPVPGGVGPMTIAMLLSNTLEAFYNGI
ncbi:MAG: bifunctional methylenetetrahydrofolate dehydrogenase/methenyltetrahydrofolate cyclohydrolase FolD [Eubacteriales bacterium]|nr:bifunctional methylenetetrahydrofolate dehydrogenase/methenyltetrahydrofolate cyclohydrolase FolD [Eubacteriales bacterium]